MPITASALLAYEHCVRWQAERACLGAHNQQGDALLHHLGGSQPPNMHHHSKTWSVPIAGSATKSMLRGLRTKLPFVLLGHPHTH